MLLKIGKAGGGVAGAGGRTRAASALELSSVGTTSSLVGISLRRRIKCKSTNSTGTQGFDVEDRIEEVDIGDDGDDEEEELEEAELEEDEEEVEEEEEQEEEEDDGVAIDEVDEVDEDDTQSGIVIKIIAHDEEEQLQRKAALAAKVKAEEELPLELAPLTVAAAAAKRRDARSLATDGHIYFPLLKINEDPHIDAKLINRKDGLQDTMYYLDEFGSPKLREKFARKQKQRLAKQQKAILKREREEQRKKRNTTVASNLAASGIDTKEQQPQQQHHHQHQAQSANNHCDRNRLTIDKQISDPHPHPTNPSSSLLHDHDRDTDTDQVKMRVRSHSHDNHYDGSRKHAPARRHSDDRLIASDGANDVEGMDDDEIDETGAEATSDAGGDCLERVKTAKLARTQSCVSWTKVVQKFKHILGKLSLTIAYYRKTYQYSLSLLHILVQREFAALSQLLGNDNNRLSIK